MAATASASVVRAHRATADWSQVTPTGTPNIADVGLAVGSRGTLNVIWAKATTSGGHAEILDTAVSPRGAVAKPVTIKSGQYLVSDPDAIVAGKQIDAVWNGIEGNSSATPKGTFVASEPAQGGHWSSPANVPPLPGIPFTTSSDSATTGADGKPWVAFTGTDSLTVLHLGHPEREIPPTACCVYNPGLAVDGHTGTTWVAYQSLIPGHEGIFTQRLNQAGTPAGGPDLLPGSATHRLTVEVSQRIGITGRGHGRSGVYVAYLTGYPSAVGVDLLKAGSSKPVSLAGTSAADQFAGATVTADAAGGLWAAWFTGDGSPASLFVRNSNSSATKFGRTMAVKLPAGTSVVWKVYISADGSRLDVVALLTRHGKTAYWVTQVS
jgi:hypothetical protein